MSLLKALFKKLTFLIAITIYVSAIAMSLGNAQTNDTTGGGTTAAQGTSSCSNSLTCLQGITLNTYQSLQLLNTFPSYFSSMMGSLINLVTSDTGSSTPTPALQSNFTALGNLIVQNFTGQNSNPVQLSIDLFSNQPTNNTQYTQADFSGNSPNVLKTLPFINDVSYSTLLGQPPVTKATATPYNYIKNASGMSITHTIPSAGWTGGADADKYVRYYKTILAIESFNSYVLNSQLINNQTLTTTQSALINQATSGDQWFAQIASEEIGKVLRQILMFNSQSYVLLAQSIQIQQQMLAAQIMTNALLIANNANNEALMLKKAQGG